MKKKKAWIVSVDMGYGHQRAAYPLKDISYERIITANNDNIVVPKEQKTWDRFRLFYESLSRIRSLPLIGEFLWRMYDSFQAISPFYPFRDLSKPNIGALYLRYKVKKGFIKSVIEYTKKKKIPFVSTFFATAVAASYLGIKDNYCAVTDTDINRIWVSADPKKNKIYYLTPTERSTRRLSAYGVPKKNIFFTGFPLPKENTGRNLEILKKDLGKRLATLDPNKVYINRYKSIIKKQLGKRYPKKSEKPLTITYAVGGAGAQKEIGADIIKSFKQKLRKKEVKLNLSAGTRLEVKEYFEKAIEKNDLSDQIGKSINILFALDKKTHFEKFNSLLHDTDILWTKPSELSFYTALGIPIIISPPLGSHELINEKWLITMGAGLKQENPRYADEWIYDWIRKGILAEAAFEGFLEAPKFGTYNIEKLIFSKDKNKVKFQY